MKKKPFIAFNLLILSLFCINAGAQVKEFYLAPNGSDEAAGTIEAPFGSFAFAKNKVKEYKQANPSSPIVVYLRGGKYYLSEPVTFTADDSGSESAPISYKAYQDEEPEILGGEKLEDLAWEKIDDHIYKTPVPSGLLFETLFVNGDKKILARYPNYDENAEVFNGTAADCISAAKVNSWADPTGGYVHGLHNLRWGGIHYRITGKSGSSLNLEGGTQNNRGGSIHGTYRFVENIFEELDDTDEWFLNRNTSELYYYPNDSIDLASAEIEYAAQEQLIVFDGSIDNPVKYISIEGLSLKRTIRTFMKTADPLLRSDWTIYRGGVVHFEGTENCALVDCELSLLGGNAVFFNNYNKNSSVVGCHIHDVGASGVCLVGDVESARHKNYNVGNAIALDELDFTRGPKNNNYPQNCLVDNNLIHHIGTIEKQTAGVHMSLSAYITVSRNSIYDVPRAGINISEGKWSGHMIEYNDVFKTVMETEDHGAFNSWGRDRYYSKDRSETNTRVGLHGESLVLLDILDSTVIRNNRFKCDHGWDIDLDDGSSYYHIYNNVCLSGGIKLRDGFYRTVENNITINSSMHQHVWLQNSGDIIRNNIFTHGYFPIGMGNWGTRVDSNLFYLESDLNNIQDSYGVDENSIFGDPLFVDPDNGDFTLGEGSLAFDIDFVTIPMDKFGVQLPKLKAIAETPEIPEIELSPDVIIPGTDYWGGIIKNIETDGELSATGLGEMKGAMVMKSPDKWIFSMVDLLVTDVILKLDDEEINDINDLKNKLGDGSNYSTMSVWRYQEMIEIDLPDLSDCRVPTLLDSKKWELISTDSENAGYLAKNSIDNNINSFWHTEFDPSDEPYPHEIVVDMGAPYVLDYLEFLGRQGNGAQRIKDFELYVSSDLKNWGDAILEGTLQNTSDLQSIKIENDNDGQYFKFVGLSGYSRQAAAIAEIDFYGGCGTNLPPSPHDRFEAETYDAERGIAHTATTDVDGGEDLEEIEDGDYIMFSALELAEADSIHLRVASATDGGVVEVRVGSVAGDIIAFIDVPNTGASTNWQTVSAEVDDLKDKNDLYFVFRGTGTDVFKLNWIQFTKYQSPFERLEAEAYTTASEDIQVYDTTDDDDDGVGGVLKYIKRGSWIHFSDVDLTGAHSLLARFSTIFEDAFVEVRIDNLDGEVIGTINMPQTGNFNTWETASTKITEVEGIHDVYFVYQNTTISYVCYSNWFQLSDREVPQMIDPRSRIEAEAYARANGTETMPTSDLDGEEEVGTINTGDWILFKDIDLTDITGIEARVASAQTGGRIELRLGSYQSSFVAIVSIPNTGSLSNWETVSADFYSEQKGKQNVYLVFTGNSKDIANVNWFKFKSLSSSMSTQSFNSGIKLYPNPVKQYLQLVSPDFMYDEVRIMDALGKVVFRQSGYNKEQTFDLNIQNGVYLLELSNSEQRIIKRFMKVN